jgi:hypothetical protein
LLDFFDQNMLQLLESERFLPDQMIPSDREALDAMAVGLTSAPFKFEGRNGEDKTK